MKCLVPSHPSGRPPRPSVASERTRRAAEVKFGRAERRKECAGPLSAVGDVGIDHVGGGENKGVLGPALQILRERGELGLRVLVWTVNDTADLLRMIDLGVDGIVTDYPDRLYSLIRSET